MIWFLFCVCFFGHKKNENNSISIKATSTFHQRINEFYFFGFNHPHVRIKFSYYRGMVWLRKINKHCKCWSKIELMARHHVANNNCIRGILANIVARYPANFVRYKTVTWSKWDAHLCNGNGKPQQRNSGGKLLETAINRREKKWEKCSTLWPRSRERNQLGDPFFSLKETETEAENYCDFFSAV